MLFDLMGFQGFAKWYAELGKLRIFWAKPVKSINLLVKEGNLYFVGVEWIVRSKIRDAIICIAKTQYEIPKIIRLLRDYGDSVKILIISEESPIDLSLVNARSILYFWNVDVKTLEPNRHTRMKVYSEWGDDELRMFMKIHKESWSFFIPPRQGDHIVLVAFLNDSPVGMTYLNIHNFNIDYGIHVIKSYWRSRIGTALLAETLKLARSMNATSISVVRVFRSVKGASSDMRAVKFYSANNPLTKMSVYRLNY
jgi:GNAT superfamily N-acetyltransferase